MVSHVRSRTERERQSGSCCSAQVKGRLEGWGSARGVGEQDRGRRVDVRVVGE